MFTVIKLIKPGKTHYYVKL